MSVVSPVASLGAAVPVLLGVAPGAARASSRGSAWGSRSLGAVLASGPEIRAGRTCGRSLLACVAAVGFGTVLFCMDRGARVSLVSTLWGMRLTSVVRYAVVAAVRRSTGGVGRRDWPTLVFVGPGRPRVRTRASWRLDPGAWSASRRCSARSTRW